MKLLQMRFPGARVLSMDAARLATERLYDGAPVGAVVSGLPLLNMSTRKVVSILGGAFSYVRPGGASYQFIYGLSCPISKLTRRPQMTLIAGSIAPEQSTRGTLGRMDIERDCTLTP